MTNIKIIKGRKPRTALTGDRRKRFILEAMRLALRWEREFKQLFLEAFNIQEVEVLKRLAFLKSNYDIIKATQEKGIADVLFSRGEQVQVFLRLARPILQNALVAGSVASLLIDRDATDPITLHNRRVQRYLDVQSSKFAEKVNDSTIKQLRRELGASIEANETIDQARQRVTKVYDQARGFRLERMARTEMGAAINFGRLERINQNRFLTGKEWVTVLDDRTRDDHEAVNGTIIPRGNAFAVGDDRLMYPRDPNGDPENIINCRCQLEAAVI